MFNNAAVSYNVSQGTGGTLRLDNTATGSTVAPSIEVDAGGETISAPVFLANGVSIVTAADPGPSSPALTISGVIGGSGGLAKAGLGMLRLTTANSYSGGTSVGAGTLRTTADGALSIGGLAIGNAAVILGGSESIGSLSMSSSSGSLSVTAGKTLADIQSSGDTSVAGAIALAGGVGSNPGGVLRKAGSSTLEINGAPALGQNSAIAVNDNGTLRLNVTAGMPTVGTGVIATVAAGATLELAGTTSALADPTALSSPDAATNPLERVAIKNNGLLQVDLNAAQQVDGSGSVTVTDDASLTADHINQLSLVIGNGSVLTLAPSNLNGNPMSATSGLALAGSLTPSTSFIATSGSPLGAETSSLSPTVSLGGGVSGRETAVPEPSSVVTLILGSLGLFAVGAAKRKKFVRPSL